MLEAVALGASWSLPGGAGDPREHVSGGNSRYFWVCHLDGHWQLTDSRRMCGICTSLGIAASEPHMDPVMISTLTFLDVPTASEP